MEGQLMERIGFIGLGLMGNPMARRLLDQGYPMTVWNRTPEKAGKLLESGATWAESPREVAAASDVVVVMVTNSDASEGVICGPSGVVEGAHPGLVLMDMSSIAPDVSRSIADRAKAAGISMLDAPVSGSVAAVANGSLGIMVGGDKETLDHCQPILQHLGTKILYAGPNGSGCALKLLNNLIMGIAVEAVCEALVLATKVGIDPALLMEITSSGGAQTAAMQSRGPRVIARDFAPRFSLANQFKDLNNLVDMARRAQVPLPVGAAAREIFQSAVANGKGDLDSAAVVTVLEALANVTVSGK
jgi:3-hydroxyisobutyrate dehydrogenase-like beta-hydroxyacid dehydrogenase